MAAAACRIGLLALAGAACTTINADARTFENSRWHATAINGRATPATGNYVIRFDKGRIGGQLGCNHFGGQYRVGRDVLTTNVMQMTLMACAEPAASFESAGMAVLQQPMRLTWSSARQLTLSNGAGSIALELLP